MVKSPREKKSNWGKRCLFWEDNLGVFLRFRKDDVQMFHSYAFRLTVVMLYESIVQHRAFSQRSGVKKLDLDCGDGICTILRSKPCVCQGR